MKIRLGFVSNSSSSSYICDVCGEERSGYDFGLREAEMYSCMNDHTFCEEHAITDPGDARYEVADKYCPCCNFNVLADGDLKDFIFAVLRTTQRELATVFKSQFKTYDEFSAFIKRQKEV